MALCPLLEFCVLSHWEVTDTWKSDQHMTYEVRWTHDADCNAIKQDVTC